MTYCESVFRQHDRHSHPSCTKSEKTLKKSKCTLWPPYRVMPRQRNILYELDNLTHEVICRYRQFNTTHDLLLKGTMQWLQSCQFLLVHSGIFIHVCLSFKIMWQYFCYCIVQFIQKYSLACCIFHSNTEHYSTNWKILVMKIGSGL